MPQAAQDSFSAEMVSDYAESMPRNLELIASAEPVAGATRYELSETVTVPDDSATMVLFLARPVPGEAVFMFAPDPGVPDSARHPFHVARFENTSPGLLERGPIAFFETRSFLGQGVLEPLAPGAKATVPFAIGRQLAVESDRRHTQRGARLARIEAGGLTIERDQVQETIYRLRNGADDAARVLVRHPRVPGMRLFDPPAGTEDNVGSGSALVPVSVGAGATATLEVEEVRPYQTRADWLSEDANLAVETFLADKQSDPKVVEKLREAWALRNRLVVAIQDRSKVTSERDILAKGAEQTRASLRAIERNRGNVADLLRSLTQRLTELDKQLADANARLVKLDLEVNELQVRFSEAVREIRYESKPEEQD